MNCPKCGHDNLEGSRYCSLCYEVLQKAPPREPQTETPAPAAAPEKKSGGISLLLIAAVLVVGAFAYFGIYRSLFPTKARISHIFVAKKYARLYNDHKYLESHYIPEPNYYKNLPPGTMIDFYQVRGRTFNEIWNNLNNELIKNPKFRGYENRRALAWCQPEYDYNWEYKDVRAGVRWNNFTITVKNKIVLPGWDSSQSADMFTKSKWNVLMSILLEHELAHAAINVEHAKKTEEKIRNLEALTDNLLYEQTVAILDKEWEFCRTLQTRFDEQPGADQEMVVFRMTELR